MIRSKIISLCIVCIFLGSCKQYVDIDPPPDLQTVDIVFSNDGKATASVTAIYGSMINSGSFANYMTTLFAALSADELVRFNPNADYEQLNANELTVTNAQVDAYWSSPYKIIYFANAAIEALNNASSLSTEVKTCLLAECRFLRAFCYFYLVEFFGDVPWITGTNYQQNMVIPRKDKQEIVQSILDELEAVKPMLNANYTGTEKVRPNKWTVTALLARIYLYTGDWQKAEANATEIINSGMYTPLANPGAVFLKTSKEAIWQLMPVSGQLTETSQMRPNGTVPRNYMTQDLLSQFLPTDLRRQKWIDSITSSGIKYYYPGKYKNTASANITEYYVMFRVAEQYLIRAEARIRLGGIAAAIDDLNVIRTRAGLPSITILPTMEQALSLVEEERRKELFCEWGHRWLDLIRTGRANTVLGAIKPLWQPTDILYPIPEAEIRTNPFLVQNPGY